MSLGQPDLLRPLWMLVPAVVLVILWLQPHRARRIGRLRLLLFATVGVALAGPVLASAGTEQRVLLLDRSASVDADALKALEDQLSDSPGFVVLPFGDDVRSPLAEALRDVAARLPASTRALVASDGRATGDDPRFVVRDMVEAGLQLDTLALPGREGTPNQDVAVVDLRVPPALRAGVRASVMVTTRSTMTGTARIEIRANDRAIARAAVSLAPGNAVTALPITATRSVGSWRIEARVTAVGDEAPQNDARTAAVHVVAPPAVLIIGEGEEPVVLADLLRERAGIRATVLGPERVPGRISALARWPVAILVDVPASALAHEQRATLAAYVRDLGNGLLMTGGRRSFVLGGWRGTVLEELAPVHLEPAPSGRRRAVSLLLLVDRSASMAGGDSRSRASKLDLAREAALLAAGVLEPGDRIGAVEYDDGARWLAPMGPVEHGDGEQTLRRSLRRLQEGGGTRILGALELGLPVLAGEDAPTRHAVLLTDGQDDHGEEEAMARAVRAARAAGVTMSTIAIGLDADEALLRRLARLGDGRFHAAGDPSRLPRLTAEESEMVRAGAEREGEVRPRAAAAALDHPLLGAIDTSALPSLGGYLALLPRPEADVVLESGEGDPILATWRVGLGTVTAWTSDVGARWATDWRADARGADAWAAVVHALAGPVGDAKLDVDVRVEPGGERARVEASLIDESGGPRSLADVSVVITDDRGARPPAAMHAFAPGRYGLTIDIGPAKDGLLAWPMSVRAKAPNAAEDDAWSPATLLRGHPEESLPPAHSINLLADLAQDGGGRAIERLDQGWLQGPGSRRTFAPWLIALATLLWPLDVALRLGRLPDSLRLSRSTQGNDAP